MGAKPAAGSTRLYQILVENAMGAGDKRSQNENMGAKTAAGSTRLMCESTFAARRCKKDSGETCTAVQKEKNILSCRISGKIT